MVVRVIQIVRLLIVLASRHRSLVFENLALRQQLAVYHRTRPKPTVRWLDRLFWVGLRLVWPDWRSALVIVRPATVIAWHRRGFAWYWTRRSRPRGGRPQVDADVRRLTREMALANPLWGAPRIHGELLKLGFDVSERTISRLMPRRRTPPSQTWRTFLENHLGSTVAIDFFAVPTLTFRILFVFVVLAHDRRRILHVNVTDHPTSTWTRQQLREAFPNNANARFLLHERDTTFDAAFGRAVEAFGLTAVPTAPRSRCTPKPTMRRVKYLSSDNDPLYRFCQWRANLRILDVQEIKTVPYVPLSHPFVERLIGTIRRECLDRTLFWTAADLEMKLVDFQRYYNGHRTHAELDGRSPEPSLDAGSARASVRAYRWQSHCRGLYQTPIAA